MTGTIKLFNLAEWYVIAAFSLLMGIACTGICHVLIGDPIFSDGDWTGIGTMLIVCVLGIVAIAKDCKNRR